MSGPHLRLPGELAFMLLLTALSLFMLWQSFGISGLSSITSAGVFPMLASLVMAVSGVIFAFQTARFARSPAEPNEPLTHQFVRRLVPSVVVGFTVAIVAYMLLFEKLGFVLASYLFLVAATRLLGSRRWILNLVVSAASLAAIYLIFQTAFSVVLPKGEWLRGWIR